MGIKWINNIVGVASELKEIFSKRGITTYGASTIEEW
jgi:hypothetical protein